MIGIIGYGMVGKAVEYGFNRTSKIISDPQYNTNSVTDVCEANPDAIFVCVPTPTDDTNYGLLKGVLLEIDASGYQGLVVVKSTILPEHLVGFDVLYNPEFLSRATSFEDFTNPPFVLIGGDFSKAHRLADLYRTYSRVNMDCVKITDIVTASIAKYAMNSFYATKVTFMNAIYDVSQTAGADFDQLINILEAQPWMGTHHFRVPGPDGQRGFGGPCLPKDTQAIVNKYKVELLETVLKLNETYRKGNDGN